MTKRQENIRIKKLEKQWEETAKEGNDAITIFFKHIKKEITIFTNYMMYRKRPSNKIERWADSVMWWFTLVIIFFAFKGFTYWLTGR